MEIQDEMFIPLTMTKSAYESIQMVTLWLMSLGAPKAKALSSLSLDRVSWAFAE